MFGKKGHKILTFKRAAAFLMSMCLLLGSSDFGLTLEAAENVSATFSEKLSEDGTSSEITMSVSAADQNTEILQIENPDGTVSGDASVTTYSVAENGTYEFTVTYQVNGEDESKETFSYIVSGIGKTEEGTAVTDENSEAGNATEEENIPDVAGEAGDGKDTNETAETETGNTGGVTAAVNGPAKAPRAVGDVEVNQENFPDSMFRGRVLEYDLDHDGFLSEEEISNVTVIAVPADGIRTLAGIEYFTALVELDCSGQGSSLTGTLDLSANTALRILDCEDNSLSQLNLSANTELITLKCGENNIRSLDLSKNNKLQTIDCSYNSLQSLDLSNNTALETLICNENRSMTSLTIENCPELRYLKCDYTYLKKIDITKNSNLTDLICSQCSLSELDVSNNTNLVNLDCSYNRDLSSLDLTNNEKLASLNCEYTGLTELDVRQNPVLKSLDIGRNSQMEMPDLSNNMDLEVLNCDWMELDNLDVTPYKSLLELNCGYNNLTELDVSQNIDLVVLHCDGNELGELDISHNSFIEELWCGSNNLENLDVTHQPQLKIFSCSGNNIKSLNLSNNTMLERFQADRNKFTYIVCGENSLEHLGTSGTDFMASNQSPELSLTYDSNLGSWRTAEGTFGADTVFAGTNVSIDPDKHYAVVPDNITEADFTWSWPGTTYKVKGKVTFVYPPEPTGIEINELNFPDDNFRAYVSENFDKDTNGYLSDEEIANVTEVNVISREINDLKGIEYFTAITKLYCGSNNLTTLDVSRNTLLEKLTCSSNHLTALDVSNNMALTTLECHSNALTALDVSENAQLAVLDCENNDLTVLDVSRNTNLVSLNCYKNNLTELKLGSKKFDEINCAENELTYITGSAVNFEDMESYSGANQLVELPVMYDEDAKVWRTADNTFMQNIEFTGADVSFVAEGNYITVPDSVESAVFEWNMPDVSQSGGTTGGWLRGTVRFVQIEGIPINEANFPDSNFRNFLLEQDYGTDGFLTSEEIKGITSMDCSEKGIADLTGIDYFTSLTELDCANNQLTSLEIETRYTSVNCSYNEISDLYLADNYDGSNLETLDCSWNQLLRIRSDEEFEQHNLKIGSVSGRNQHVSVTLTYDETNSSWKSQDQILGPNTNFTVYDAPDSMTADTELGCIRSTAGTDITSALYSAYVCGMDAQSNNIGGEITITYNYVRNGYIAVEEAQALERADDLKQFRLFGGLSLAEEASLSIEVADFTGMQAGTRKAYNVTYSWTDDSGVPVQETREITVVPEGSSFTPSRNSYISLATDLEYNIGETMTVGNFDWLRLNGLAALNAGKGQFTSGTYEPAYEKIVALTSGIMGRAEWVVKGVLHYTEYGNYPVTYTIQVGAEQLKITQMVHVMPDEPTGLVIIPSSIELEQVKGSPTIEASTTSEVSLETDAQGDYMPDVNITADAEFQITNRDQESLECVVYVNGSKYDGSGPLAVLNKNRDVVSQQFEIRALKGDEGYTGEFNGTMNFTVSYEE